MSARTATTGPGWPPRRTATTPVLATPVRTSKPSGWSLEAMSLAVSVSRLPSSGFMWMKRRILTISALFFSISASTRRLVLGSTAQAEDASPMAKARMAKAARRRDGALIVCGRRRTDGGGEPAGLLLFFGLLLELLFLLLDEVADGVDALPGL